MNPPATAEIDWRVYVIVDPDRLHPDRTLEETTRAACRGGAGVIQLRDKEGTDRQRLARARRLKVVCRTHGARFVVNDRLDIALAAEADGLHLGPDDLPIVDARRVAPDLLIGGSAGTVERAVELQKAGADYLGCGAVYDAAPSKPDASDPRGPERIAEIVDAVDIPVVGIGGITPDNAPPVLAAGAAGVAVIRAVVAQADPESATRHLHARSLSG